MDCITLTDIIQIKVINKTYRVTYIKKIYNKIISWSFPAVCIACRNLKNKYFCACNNISSSISQDIDLSAF